MQSREYRTDIDGLRGVAVLMVILFHAGFGFPGGYIGVDIFFVISGFLITQVALRELVDGQFSLTQFWIRRTRRIAPAAITMCLATVVAGYFLLIPSDYESLGRSSVAQVLMTTNFHFVENLNYFDGSSDLQPLLHMWSLAVEEQFYVLFPIVLMLAFRGTKRSVAPVLITFSALSFAAGLVLTPTHPRFAFFLLPTRAWELLLGSLVALAPKPNSLWRKRFALVQLIALVAALVCSWWFDGTVEFPGCAALLPCLLAAILVYSGPPETSWSSQLLTSRWLAGIGRMSYSLYLWHWPILAFFRHVYGQELAISTACLAVGLAFFATVMSYHFVEEPVRRKQILASTHRLFAATGCGLAVLLALALTVKMSKGLPDRLPPRIIDVARESRIPNRYRTGPLSSVAADKLPTLGIPPELSGRTDFLLWGDSHAMAIADLLHQIAIKYQLSGQIAARSSVIPLVGPYCAKRPADAVSWNQSVLRHVQAHRIPYVILASRWTVYVEGFADGESSTLIRDRNSPETSRDESKRVFKRGLASTLTSLDELGTSVWIMGQIPLQTHDPCREYLAAAFFNRPKSRLGISLAKHRADQLWVDTTFAAIRSRNVRILDPTQSCFDTSEHSVTGSGDVPYYSDDDHLSPTGARILLSSLFEPILKEIADRKFDVGDVETVATQLSNESDEGVRR